MNALAQFPGTQTQAPAMLTGRKLALVRTAWLAGVFLTVLFYMASITVRIDYVLDNYSQFVARMATLGLSNPFIDYYPLFFLMADIATTLIFWFTGAFIAWRKSSDRMGLIVSFALITFGATITLPLDLDAIRPIWQVPVMFGRAMGLSGFLIFLYVFPSGSFRPRWTRYLAAIFCIWSLSWVLLLHTPADPYTWGALPANLVVLGWFASGIAVQFYRYLRLSSPIQQQQSKWIVFGITVPYLISVFFNLAAGVLPTINQANFALLVYTLVSQPVFLLSMLLVPATITISILRYRLWDIDLIINRALVFGLLTVTLGVVYLVSVVVLQQAFQMVTGQTSELAIVYSTLAIAALFNPLRHALQTIIDRRFYRHKYDATQTLAAFSATVRDEVELSKLNEDLLGVVEEAMQPSHVSLWLRHPDGKG